jgi:hypothetical protein
VAWSKKKEDEANTSSQLAYIVTTTATIVSQAAIEPRMEVKSKFGQMEDFALKLEHASLQDLDVKREDVDMKSGMGVEVKVEEKTWSDSLNTPLKDYIPQNVSSASAATSSPLNTPLKDYLPTEDAKTKLEDDEPVRFDHYPTVPKPELTLEDVSPVELQRAAMLARFDDSEVQSPRGIIEGS